MTPELMTTDRTVAEITADIRLNQRQAAVSIAAIGADLIDAKTKLSHGEWMPWLESIDMAQSTADNYMRFARETSGQEWLRTMPYSKAMALLTLPEESRQKFAKENNVDEKSAAEIKRLIAEAKKARAAADAEREKAARALADEQAKREAAESQAETLRRQIRDRPEKIIEKQVEPADYSTIKGQVAELRERLSEAEGAAIEAEERAAEAASEAQQLKRQLADIGAGEEIDTGADVIALPDLMRACNDFTTRAWMAPHMADYFRETSPTDRRGYRLIVESVAAWAAQTLEAIRRSEEPIVLPQEVIGYEG